MKLYSTLSKHIEVFKPLNPKEVTMYSCGPTVYDRAHIGNFRTYILEDTLRRTILLNGYRLKHVMNITDVDDKTIKRSHQKYPDIDPQDALRKLTGHYEDIFYKDAKSLGIDLAQSQMVKATDEIEAMKQLIAKIPSKYITDDGIYFDIRKYPDYGAFVKLDDAHAQHRISNDEYDKASAADFSLWKLAKPGEPSWTFDIDRQQIIGRPGWHLECSAISTKYLGQPFDIHTGGVDLIFPHHENELAQSKSATGSDLANYFVHIEHLLVDGRKMSKSLNNFYTLVDVEKKGFDPLAFRLLALQAHYRTQLNFTWEALESFQSLLNKFNSWADLQFQNFSSKKLINNYNEAIRAIQLALSSDLDTVQALTFFNGMVNRVEDLGVDSVAIAKSSAFLDQVFGLALTSRQNINSEQEQLIKKREDARKSKDWVEADVLRKKLLEDGILVRDTPDGPIWSRDYSALVSKTGS